MRRPPGIDDDEEQPPGVGPDKAEPQSSIAAVQDGSTATGKPEEAASVSVAPPLEAAPGAAVASLVRTTCAN